MKKAYLKILLLAVFVQFFCMPAVKFEHSQDFSNESFIASKAHFGVIQKEWEEGERQPVRKGNPPGPDESQETCLIPIYEKFIYELSTAYSYTTPVSTSYQGSKLEVLNSRSHPPTLS